MCHGPIENIRIARPILVYTALLRTLSLQFRIHSIIPSLAPCSVIIFPLNKTCALFKHMILCRDLCVCLRIQIVAKIKQKTIHTIHILSAETRPKMEKDDGEDIIILRTISYNHSMSYHIAVAPMTPL